MPDDRPHRSQPVWTSRLLALVVAMTVVGCVAAVAAAPNSGGPPPKETHPVGEVLRMPDDFGDVAVTCDGTTRVYVTEDDVQSSSAVAVVPNHPACRPVG